MLKEVSRKTLDIPEAPGIPGLVFRYFQDPSDYANIKAVFDVCKDLDDFEYTMTLEDVAHHFEHLINSDPYQDMIFVEVDGQVIAYSRVWWVEESGGDYVYGSLGFIRPEWRRKGIGTAILSHNERRLRQIAEGHPPKARKFFDNESSDARVGVAALLRRMGYEEIRWGYEMKRSIDDPLPEAPMPAGLEVRPAIEAHYRPIFEAANEAFRDHWGHIESTEENYQRWMTDPHFDPSLWKVAWEGDQVAGMVLNFVNHKENEEYGRKRGWTDPICVRRPWRRRGLARALLVQSVLMFREMGFDDTALGVDTQNRNHALNLYQGVGYQVVRKHTTWRKEMK
jgi:mycothiol synthase